MFVCEGVCVCAYVSPKGKRWWADIVWQWKIILLVTSVFWWTLHEWQQKTTNESPGEEKRKIFSWFDYQCDLSLQNYLFIFQWVDHVCCLTDGHERGRSIYHCIQPILFVNETVYYWFCYRLDQSPIPFFFFSHLPSIYISPQSCRRPSLAGTALLCYC